jgi:hypothetical protein
LGAPKKSEVAARKNVKTGISLSLETFQKLDFYAESKFKGTRSAAANYLWSALQKKSP